MIQKDPPVVKLGLPHKQLFQASSRQTQRAAGSSRGCKRWGTGTASRPRWWSVPEQSGGAEKLKPGSPRAVPKSQPRSSYLEEVERWVKDLLDDLLQELLEDAVLVDARFVHAQVVHKLHPDDALHGVLGELAQLLVAVLGEARGSPGSGGGEGKTPPP